MKPTVDYVCASNISECDTFSINAKNYFSTNGKWCIVSLVLVTTQVWIIKLQIMVNLNDEIEGIIKFVENGVIMHVQEAIICDSLLLKC